MHLRPRRNRSLLSALVLLAACWPVQALAQDVVSVTSPNGRIEFRLLDGPPAAEAGTALPRLSYQVDFDGKRLIDTSYLGFEIYGQLPLGDKLALVDTLRESKDETYTLQAGKAKVVRNHYNEVIAEYMQNGSLGRRVTLIVRAFDDGVAFRYFVPVSPPLEEMLIENEGTQFAFAQDAESYPLLLRNFTTGYDDQFSKATLSGIHPESLIGLPFLVRQPGVAWVAITEADVDQYPGLYLSRVEGIDNLQTFRGQLSPQRDGSGLALRERTPLATPWRVLLINDTPFKLLESNMIASLNASSQIADTSWIQPGKSAWTRWNSAPREAGSAPAAGTTAEVKRSIDFAASLGLEYLTLDAGWASLGPGGVPDLLHAVAGLDMPAVAAYARQKKVGLWLWTPWAAVDAQMEPAFAQFKTWGVRGVQIDGMRRDDVWMVNFYRRAAEAAARHQLMVDFQGAFKPDGMQRTFPNVLTRDAVLGLDATRTSARANPDHNVMLAYTRLLAGSLSYTPGGFNNVTREEFRPREDRPMVLGTRAHQLALLVLFESPLQVLPDVPEAYQGQLEVEFLRAVPATWDETRGVAGEVGGYVAAARKKDTDWYLGAITNWTARELKLPLNFLGAGNYTAEIYADAADAALHPQHTVVSRQQVDASASLNLTLAPGGGAAVRFTPLP